MWRSIRMKLVIVYLLLILFSLQMIGGYFVRTLTASLIHNQTQAVQSQAQLLATLAAPQLSGQPQSTPSDAVASVLSSFPQFLNGSVYLLGPDGVVLNTSAGSALVGLKRTDSVATQALLERKTVDAIRFDPLTSQHVLAVAVPMNNNHGFVGIVEYVVPIQETYNLVRQVTTIFYTGSAFVLLLTALLGVVLSRAITRPVLDVTAQARTMVGGDFSQRVEVRSDDEFGDLARAVNDLTDKLEDALAANLREQERLKAVIKFMGDGVVTFDAAMNPQFLNEVALRLVPGAKESPAMVVQTLGLEGIQPNAAMSEREYVRTIDDTLLHVHLTAIQGSDQLEGYVAVIRDVTEQEKLNQARRDFVANVSHELRTPLTSVTSYIEAMADLDPADDGRRTSFLAVIRQETDRMVRLTRDLLHLSGLERAQHTYRETVIDVNTWLQQAITRLQLQAQSSGIEFVLDKKGAPMVRGDQDMLDRLLDNVLGNAIQYSVAGGQVTVRARVSKGDLRLQVSDTGIGIPAEDIPHVFERFYRVEKARSRRRGGTGLGLALAREITERHGGRIHIESPAGVGTTVEIRLPLTEEVVR